MIHIHSTYSKGKWPIKRIAEFAKQKGIDVLLLTDALWERYEYGIAPFRGIFKKRFERQSVLKEGAEQFLKDVQEANILVPDVLTLAGVTATPFYYWSGSIAKGPLVLNGRGKDILVFGLEDAEAYEQLPVMNRKNSEFSAYDGDQGIKPHQNFIDQVNRFEGLSFWSHPNADENALITSKFGVVVRARTKPYAKDLLRTQSYTGFGIYPTDLSQVGVAENDLIIPGGIWDQLLMEYLRGKRQAPVWMVGETDYTGTAQPKSQFNVLVNQILVKEKTQSAVLQSLKEGRSYVTMPDQTFSRHVRVNAFYLTDSQGARAEIGETLKTTEPPMIHLDLAFSNQASSAMTVMIVRNGDIFKIENAILPQKITIQDSEIPRGKKSYYRIIAYSEEQDRLLTNPIFVEL